jgi:hypothetical protein
VAALLGWRRHPKFENENPNAKDEHEKNHFAGSDGAGRFRPRLALHHRQPPGRFPPTVSRREFDHWIANGCQGGWRLRFLAV